MDLTQGKNFKLLNEFGIHHDLYNPALGKDYLIRIYSKFDLLVDDTIKESPQDYWIVMQDLDGKYFAHPIDAEILAEKLMTLGLVPITQIKMERKEVV